MMSRGKIWINRKLWLLWLLFLLSLSVSIYLSLSTFSLSHYLPWGQFSFQNCCGIHKKDINYFCINIVLSLVLSCHVLTKKFYTGGKRGVGVIIFRLTFIDLLCTPLLLFNVKNQWNLRKQTCSFFMNFLRQKYFSVPTKLKKDYVSSFLTHKTLLMGWLEPIVVSGSFFVCCITL